MKVCEQCGKLNYNDGAKFCPHCGGALTDYAAHKRQKLMRKVKIGGGLGTAAVVVALIAFAVIWFAPNDVIYVYEDNGKVFIYKENGYGETHALYSANADMSGYKLLAENAVVDGSTPSEDFVWNGVLYAGSTALNLTSGQRATSYAELSSKRFYDGLVYEASGSAVLRLEIGENSVSERETFYELPVGAQIGWPGVYVRDGYLYVKRQTVGDDYDNRLSDIDMVSLYDPTQVVSFSSLMGNTFVGDSGENSISTVWNKITVYGFNFNDPWNKFQTYHNYGFILADVEYNGGYYHITGNSPDMTVYKAVLKHDGDTYSFEETEMARLPSYLNENGDSFFRDGKYYFLRGKTFYVYSLSRPNQLLKYVYKDKKTGYVLTEISGELSGNAYVFDKKGVKVTSVNTSSGNMGRDIAPPQSTQRPVSSPAVTSVPEPTPSAVVVADNYAISDIDCLLAYYEIVNELQKVYGDYDGDSGIVYAKLVDFEADNNPELLVIRREYGQYNYEHPMLFSVVYGYSAQGGVFEILSYTTAMGKYKIAKDSSGKWYLLSYFFGDGDANHNIYVDTVTDGQQMNVALYMDRAKTGINYTLGYQGTTVTYDEIMGMYPGEFCDPNKTGGAYDFLNGINVGDMNALFPVAEQYDNSTVSAPAPTNDWLVQPTFDYAQIHYCPYHGFYSTSRSSGNSYTDANGNLVIVRDGASYILDENLNIVEEHLGHGLDSPVVFYNEWSGDWYPDWIGKNLSDFFGNEPYSGSFVSGHLDNGWIAGGVGVIRDNKIIINASQEIEAAMWLGTACAYKKNNRWTIALDNGEEVATGLFGVKESYSQKSEKPYCFAANNGNLWGVVSIIGDTVLPFEYEDIVVIDNTRVYAKQNGKYGVFRMNWAG